MSRDNLLWLQGQALKTAKGSVSEVLDRLVGDARGTGWTEPGAVQSVVGTVDLPEDDPDLLGADAYIQGLFAASARQPLLVRERPVRPRTRAKKTPRG